jgi:hypothetical protein
MFQTKKFLQIVGISMINTFLISFVLGLINFDSYVVFLIIQLLVTYGTIGILSVLWLPQTPYTAAYLGATSIALLNILFSYYIFNILVFADPSAINRSMSWAVITSILFVYITKLIKSKNERGMAI